MCNCCSLTNKILCICRCEYEYFFNKLNVIGVGLGYKTTKGVSTPNQCIVVFVSQKIPSNELPQNHIIPAYYKGIRTDVVESGTVSSCGLKSRIRPVRSGYSISGTNKFSRTGTMGCLVYNGHLKYLLSNNHIIADENRAKIGDAIIQPGLDDKGKPSKDIIAHLSRFIPLSFNSSKGSHGNYCDCAIAELVNDSIAVPDIEYIGKLKGIQKPKLKESVVKVGRTTGKTSGKITTIGTTMMIDYDTGECVFYDQTITTKMGEGGDSGAILVDKNNYALGLFCGTSNSCTTYNPIDLVLDFLSVHLVTR